MALLLGRGIWQYLTILSVYLCSNLVIPLLGIYLRGIPPTKCENMHKIMQCSILFAIIKCQKRIQALPAEW